MGGEDVGLDLPVFQHGKGVAAGHEHVLELPIFQTIARGHGFLRRHQLQIVAGDDEDGGVHVVDRFFAVDGALRRFDPDLPVGVQAPDFRPAVGGLAVPRRQDTAVDGDIALNRARIAPRDIGPGVLIPFDALMGIDLDRLIALYRDRLRRRVFRLVRRRQRRRRR